MMHYIRKILAKGIKQAAHSMEGEMTRRIAFEIRKTQRRFIKFLISFFIMALALIFLAIGVVYMSVEYFAFTKTLAFLTIGIGLLFIGIIIKLTD